MSKKCFLVKYGCCGEDDRAVVTIRPNTQLCLNPSMIGTTILEPGRKYSFCQRHAEYCGIINRPATAEELLLGAGYRGFEYLRGVEKWKL